MNFTRTLNVGTGDGLPTGSSQRDDSEHGTRVRVLDMPISKPDGLERIGAFDCEADDVKSPETYNVTTIITHADGNNGVLEL